jgi:hypothetical protein
MFSVRALWRTRSIFACSWSPLTPATVRLGPVTASPEAEAGPWLRACSRGSKSRRLTGIKGQVGKHLVPEGFFQGPEPLGAPRIRARFRRWPRRPTQGGRRRCQSCRRCQGSRCPPRSGWRSSRAPALKAAATGPIPTTHGRKSRPPMLTGAGSRSMGESGQGKGLAFLSGCAGQNDHEKWPPLEPPVIELPRQRRPCPESP